MTRSVGFVGTLILGLFVPAARAEERPLRQLIDQEIRAAWEREKITPSPRADDATFLRRVYLDLVGATPSYEEARQFLQDADPKKREKLIDRLLDDPRFATHQAEVWDYTLFGRNPPNGDATRNRDTFKQWLSEKFAKNEPYDRWVKELLEADTEGPALFYVQYRNQPEETTVAVSRIFLGTQLQCARCHDHPYEVWTQKDFYGMAAFFARLVVVDGGMSGTKKRYLIGEKGSGEVLFTGPAKDQKPGQKGEPIKPKYLGGEAVEEPAVPKDYKDPTPEGKMPPKPAQSRKAKLAAWVVAPDNPYFNRAVANRVWSQYLGRGIVHPVDDLNGQRQPSHPALFQAMTEQLAARRYDLKWLIRELVNSETYQLAATGDNTDALPQWFERARVRPLSAEEMLASLRVATGFDAATRAAGEKPGQEKLPSGLAEYVIRNFGEPTNGRGDFQASLSEHLFLNNSGHLRQLIQPRKGNLAHDLAASKAPVEERVEQLFLSVLSRPPRPEERDRFAAHLSADAKKPDALIEEAIWVLVNCAEFRFNH